MDPHLLARARRQALFWSPLTLFLMLFEACTRCSGTHRRCSGARMHCSEIHKRCSGAHGCSSGAHRRSSGAAKCRSGGHRHCSGALEPRDAPEPEGAALESTSAALESEGLGVTRPAEKAEGRRGPGPAEKAEGLGGPTGETPSSPARATIHWGEKNDVPKKQPPYDWVAR